MVALIWCNQLLYFHRVVDFSGPDGKEHLAEVLKDLIDKYLDDMTKNPPKTQEAIEQVNTKLNPKLVLFL